MAELLTKIDSYRVSSVLNKDVKSYGKQFLLDGKEETCWNSEKGTCQWIQLNFKEDVVIKSLQIQFQGGFAGRECLMKIKPAHGAEILEPFYPEDNNAMQTFPLSRPCTARQLTVAFESSSDFFGRVVVYSLNLTS